MSSAYVTEFAQADHDAQATAATTETFTLGEVQYDGMVTEVALVPTGPVTPNDTAYRTFTLVNKGGDGTLNVTIATLSTNVAGGAWVANDEKQWVLTGTNVARHVSSNDVLIVVETVTGAGVAHPQFQVTVKGQRD